ncbi:MAG: hypothetical protein AAGC55_29960, partial [Myxococcota bacterium]
MPSVFASIPFGLLSLGLVGFILTVLLTRGEPLLRVAMAAMATVSLMWALGMTASLGMPEPESATIAARLAVGPLSLVGPALLFTLLALFGV